jgi:hypothetical protein
MEENLFKLNESFRFDISISDRCYDHKPTSEDYKSMSFHVENLSADELIDRIKSGHSICHVFNDNRRTKKNFIYTSAVFIDVDDSPLSMKAFLEGCELKPSIAYTTFSNGKNGSYRFRLIYLFDKHITSTDEGDFVYADPERKKEDLRLVSASGINIIDNSGMGYDPAKLYKAFQQLARNPHHFDAYTSTGILGALLRLAIAGGDNGINYA